MSQYTEFVGARIRMYRKAAGCSLEDLSGLVHKSRSTISKYELGQISIDMDTLIEIAHALRVSVHSLTDFSEPDFMPDNSSSSFFSDGLLYTYWLLGQGKRGKLVRSVLEIKDASRHATLYMQFPDFNSYTDCKIICNGDIFVTEQLTTIKLQNPYCVSDYVFACAYTPMNNRQTTTLCQFSTITTPAAPISTKILLSKRILTENEELFRCLEISKEEIANIKKENRFRVFPLPFD